MKQKTGLFWAAVLLLAALLAAGCGAKPQNTEEEDTLAGLSLSEHVPLAYAEQFTIDRYKGGYSLIGIDGGARYLVVPEDGAVPEGLDEDIFVIRQPVGNLYVAANAVVGLFDRLENMDAVTFTSTKEDGWYLDAPRRAMEAGKLRYVGEYSEPDYELLLASGCTMAVETAMIEQTPEVGEKLQELGILVFVDCSNRESHPLGRSEWVKVYGEILGKSAAAEALFEEQRAYMDGVAAEEGEGRTVAFFYINSKGQAVARRSGDYVSKMIAMAGGENVFASLDDPESTKSSVTMEMEQFYEEVKDADVILYNNSLGGGVASIEELVARNGLLKDCKAVREGNVWCTQPRFYQETLALGRMVYEMHLIFTAPEEAEDLQFLCRLPRSAA